MDNGKMGKILGVTAGGVQGLPCIATPRATSYSLVWDEEFNGTEFPAAGGWVWDRGAAGSGVPGSRGAEVFAAANGAVWETGIDELYRSSGPSQQTRLNEVVMTGFGLHAGVWMSF